MNVLSLLGVIFITLKLIGAITWSWWLVLLPLYGGLVLFIMFMMLVSLIRPTCTLSKQIQLWRKRG